MNGLQINLRQGQVSTLYSPNRDIAYNFAGAAKLTAARLSEGGWDDARAIAGREGLKDRELAFALSAFQRFISEAPTADKSMEKALAASGWLEARPAAQVLVMASLGTVMLGYYFSGIREASGFSGQTVMSLDELEAQGRRTQTLLTLPRWRRRLFLWKQKLLSAWEAIRK